MAKKKNDFSMYLLAIVAIVAIVGIYLMLGGSSSVSETDEDAEIISDEEFALEKDISFNQESDLSGEAFTVGQCHDEDADSTKDKNQLFVQGTTTYKGKSRSDKCKTYGGKSYLFEYFCRNNGRWARWQFNCAKLNYGKPGADYQCVTGACVNLGDDEVQEYPYCDDNLLYGAQGGGVSNCEAQINPYTGLSKSCVGEPGEASCQVACDDDFYECSSASPTSARKYACVDGVLPFNGVWESCSSVSPYAACEEGFGKGCACTPGKTDEKDCVKKGDAQYFKTLHLNEDCSTYYSWPYNHCDQYINTLGWTNNSCDGELGCCFEKPTDLNECIDTDGDGVPETFHNQTKDLCTDDITEIYIDCTGFGFCGSVETYGGVLENKCMADCEDGEERYFCEIFDYYAGPKYYKKSCNIYYSNYKHWSSVSWVGEATCPPGANCYDPYNLGCA
ncbi:hypothetical protein HN695_01860 [Candidatus Woesearchaeota archaeon]|jgi:hypothetical protein|nr:hypothetical protein [Candidatus Woesearchaeota archaeon]MBT5273144.1 hypothetical protein [Candidatus Woesearchaeota archaeon]MBT6041623.1 hypothetical protein [Candidatus Woesearchaeota archaeon]MBT6337541.1 hypothetical protein [Candidatus Woesearchaeota archaeon]MBT7927058.1 hypothetical protein [Candidatus Woesearchaeota archaeon]